MQSPFDIVHVTHGPFPDDPRPRREANAGAQMGLRIAVICLQDRPNRRPVGRYHGIAIVRLKGSKRRGSVGKYLIEYVDFLLRARWLIRRDARFRSARIVHVHTLPDFLIAAAEPARRAGARIVLDLHEVFPEFARSKFRGAIGVIGERLARILESWSRRRADAVLTVNRATEGVLRTRPARTGEWITVIHNSADPRDLGPTRITGGSISQPLRLVYHGTLTPLYGLDLAITAVQLAAESGADSALHIYGDGPDAERLRDLATASGLINRVMFYGAVPPEVLREQLPTYDAGFIPTRLDTMTQYSLSTKLLEYVHLGVPLLLPRLRTYLAYLPESTAWYFEPNDARSAAQAIERYSLARPEERVRRAASAQEATKPVNWERDAQTLQGIYRDLLGRRDHPR